MTALQVLALDYLVGVYPLLLIALTYFAVMLHDRYSLIVKIWGPVNRLCRCIRKQWDIRGSLVQAFATFLVLSYVKILNVSFDLLTPMNGYRVNGTHIAHGFLYYAGDVLYFGKEHFPYGVLAAVMFTIFNILPVILLSLYPCSCFQKCLNCCHLNSLALCTFMDAFQGCYRHQPRNCRYFAAIYLFVRILQLQTAVATKSALTIPITGLCVIVLSLTIIIFKPYKHDVQNMIDATFFLLLACASIMTVTYLYSTTFEPEFPTEKPYYALISLIPVFYGVGLLLYKIVPSKIVIGLKRLFRTNAANQNKELHYRFANEYSPLF